jgi:hypothetical protein
MQAVTEMMKVAKTTRMVLGMGMGLTRLRRMLWPVPVLLTLTKRGRMKMMTRVRGMTYTV